MENNKIILRLLRNGPIIVVKEGKVLMALCRCGASNNKPYCDNTHSKVDFKADESEIKIE